jgi:hypothetical protein
LNFVVVKKTRGGYGRANLLLSHYLFKAAAKQITKIEPAVAEIIVQNTAPLSK